MRTAWRRAPCYPVCVANRGKDAEPRTVKLFNRSNYLVWHITVARKGHGMVEFSMDVSVIRLLLDEIYQSIEQTKDREIREHQANCAWLQVNGMRKIISVGEELYIALHDRQEAGSNNEYQQIRHLLDAALEKIEQLVDERSAKC